MNNPKFLLTLYALRLKDRKSSDYHVLNQITTIDKNKNELKVDFLDLFKKYLSKLLERPWIKTDSDNLFQRSLSMEEPFRIDKTSNRIIYGHFNIGVNEGDFRAKEEYGQKGYSFIGKDGKSAIHKEFFFYIYVPVKRKTAYLILQRKGRSGTLINFRDSFNSIVRSMGYNFLNVDVKNLLDDRALAELIESKNLQEVAIIKHFVPANLENTFDDPAKSLQQRGKLKFVYESRGSFSLPPGIKDGVLKIVNNKKAHHIIELGGGITVEPDDICFKIDIGNRKTKTYYLRKDNLTLPERDVYEELSFNEDGTVSIDSLVSVCKEYVTEHQINV